ncbi:MAG: hypothetical protein EA412_08860 [Chitinophagaceae bacterium]|nr:MAG: hypothetical protein EA412_08860 [Chitinophagaceae bacterium]
MLKKNWSKGIFKCGFFYLLFLVSTPTNAQFFDDFSNPVLDPEWSGELSKFMINPAERLQLDAPSVQDSAWISRPSSIIDDAEWQIWVNLNFPPSNNNRLSIYLVSDEEDLTGPLNGYFLRIGENGNNDAIELYRQTGYTKDLLARGTDGFVTNAFSMRFKVTRDASGVWEVSADPTGSTFFQTEFTVQDATYTNTSYFGMVCYYTATRSDQFFFDEIYAGAPLIDTDPPVVLEVIPRSSTELEIVFDEGVEETTAAQTSNYFVSAGVGNPINAFRNPQDFSRVTLEFQNPFPSDGSTLALTVDGVEDASGNAVNNQIVTFTFYLAKFNDIIMSEIFPRTTPVVGLPAHQFIELYNRSGRDINLNGWTYSDRSSTTFLPDFTLQADSFVLLSPNAGVNQLSAFGEVLGLSPWPSLNLTSDELTLRNDEGELIFYLNYTNDWYGDDQKKNEGWSLEMIDIDNPCGDADNWTASVDPSGGTPGRENSVSFSNPDLTAPQLIRAFPVSENEVVLFFDKRLDSISSVSTSNFSISEGIGEPQIAEVISPAFREIKLSLNTNLTTGVTYNVTVANVSDCSGNNIEDGAQTRFGIPEPIEEFDIIINELLFHPVTGGVRFIELYNRSEKVVNLEDLRILRIDPNEGTTVGNPVTASTEPFLMFPGDFIVITPNATQLNEQYEIPDLKQVISVSGFPAYPNGVGVAQIRNYQAEIIDNLQYDNSWHFDLLDSRGVSLERVHYDRPTQDKNNWRSAASTVGYATPGYKNSQHLEFEISGQGIYLEDEVFSPDGDGFRDYLNIFYEFDAPGFVANVNIHDSEGRLVRRLIKNKFMDKEGMFSWDGINKKGEKASIGIYIVVAEIFDLEGNIKTYKLSCVLGGRL